MLRNYLKIALRTLWKHKGITAINVLGLAAGIAVCLLVGLLLWDQVTHDGFHPGADRIHRVTTMRQQSSTPYASSPARLAPVLRDNVSGIEAATRLKRSEGSVSHDNEGYRTQGLYAEPQFFDLFGFSLKQGRASEGLTSPFTAVITEDLARRLYGDQSPMGKRFTLADIGDFTVQTRIRDIGIRNALGATVSSVVGLLSKEFLWLVGAAVVVGLPAAWWLNHLWLQNMAVRIELTALPFVASAAGLIGLALLAVGSQTIRAAQTDPARTLRDE